MTTERGNTDAQRGASRRGPSRRQMIKASAVAGAAAWTAPVIIDSLTSPAAAGSQCHKYYVKFIGADGSGTEGKCFDANPACGPGRESGTCSVCPGNTQTPNDPHPTLFPPGTGVGQSGYTDFYRVVLDGTSTFRSTLFNWSVMGNYEICHSGGGCTTPASAASGTIPSGVGYYVDGGNTAYVAATNVVGTKSYPNCYIYVQYCSTTAKVASQKGGNCTDCSSSGSPPVYNCGT